MSESPNLTTQVDEIIAEVLQLLKRCEDMLNLKKDYVAWHNLTHSINDIHKKLLDFNELRIKHDSMTPQSSNIQNENVVLSRGYYLLAVVNGVLENYEISLRLAEKAVAQNISTAVFDRNGYLYHGKVKALADAAREGGLKF